MIAILAIPVGLVLLVGGASALVSGAQRLARRLGMSEFLIGATVVAAGTSMPELLVSVVAAIDHSDIALANVVGSNITNVALILGLSALIVPLSTDRLLVRWEIPVLLAASISIFAIGASGEIGRLDGALLLAGFVTFLGASVVLRKPVRELIEDIEGLAHPPKAARRQAPVSLGLVVAGIALLAGGAQLFVEGASELATEAGVSEFVIGATVVAIGTSLPELVTSVVAAWRGLPDVAIANVVGSNIFNALLILGVSAVVSPLAVDSDLLRFELPVLVATSVLLAIVVWPGYTITRREGALLVATYIAFDVLLFVRA